MAAVGAAHPFSNMSITRSHDHLGLGAHVSLYTRSKQRRGGAVQYVVYLCGLPV